jgi:hypothetical protein
VDSNILFWVYIPKMLNLGVAKVIRMYIESTVPAIPEIAAKIKYRVPISLLLVEESHRFAKLNN